MLGETSVHNNKKKKLVEKFLNLKASLLMSDSELSLNSDSEYSKHMRLKFSKEQVDLHLKYFDIEQLEALLSFYDTAIGKSILENQIKIDHEISSDISIISDEVHHQAIEEIQSTLSQKNTNTSCDRDGKT